MSLNVNEKGAMIKRKIVWVRGTKESDCPSFDDKHKRGAKSLVVNNKHQSTVSCTKGIKVAVFSSDDKQFTYPTQFKNNDPSVTSNNQCTAYLTDGSVVVLPQMCEFILSNSSGSTLTIDTFVITN